MEQIISTPEQYEAFKSGQSIDAHISYIIESGIHPNIFGEVRHFANYPVESITFNDGNNYIKLQYGQKYVRTFFAANQIASGQLVNLPADYKRYNIYVRALSAVDIDALEQWRSADSIFMMATTKPNEDIAQRIQQLAPKLNIWFGLSFLARTSEEMQVYANASH